MAYTDTDDKPPTDDDKLLEKAKKCYKRACDAESKQVKREIEDLRFQVPEYQWDEEAKEARKGRPMLSISKQDAPVQLVQNQARQAQLGVSVHPVSEEADDDTAEVFEGIYRSIERDPVFPANQARMWAFDRGTKCGRGVYRVNTVWDEDTADPWDQKIVIERILDARSVKFDPSAQKADFSDGKWAFVGVWYDLDDFKREYPNAKVDMSDDATFRQSGQDEPDWVRGDSENKGLLVTEYWYKVFGGETLTHPETGKQRKKETVTVYRATCTGFEVLEKEKWNGQYIPLIPYIGKELQPFDADRRYVGMIRPTRDAQKFHNYSASSFAERMALEPRVPYIGAEGQFAGHEEEWKKANVRNFPYLEYNPKSHEGTLLPPPQRAQLDATGMSLSLEGLNVSNDWIQAATGIYDASLGKPNPRDRSGRAVIAHQQVADAGNNHYMASLADTTLAYEALVILDLIPHIYDRPGRITRILGLEDEVTPVMLNAPFVMDQNTGQPMPAQQGQQGAKNYDLTKGKYAITVSIGKSYQTKMQEGQEEIGAILQADPSLMPLIGSIYFRYRDSPGSKEIAEILKELRDKQFPGLGQKKDQAPTPEQLQAQVQAMQQKGEELAKQLQGAIEQIKTDQAKQQATIEKARIDAAAAVELQRMRSAAAINVAQINAEAKGAAQESEARTEAIALAQEHAYGDHEREDDQAHEVGLKAMEQKNAKEQVREGQAHEAGMAGAGREHEMTMAERAAKEARESEDRSDVE